MPHTTINSFNTGRRISFNIRLFLFLLVMKTIFEDLHDKQLER